MSDHQLGRRLQLATIAWNAFEVFVTIGLGAAAGSLALDRVRTRFPHRGFASLVVLWHMNPAADDRQSARDARAHRLVALAFATLAAYLLIAGARSLWVGSQPESSPAGIAYLSVTAAVMFTLARSKRRVGLRLDSRPFTAEATMTFLDGCLAVAILTALVLNTAFGWWWADPLAAMAIGLVAAERSPRDLKLS